MHHPNDAWCGIDNSLVCGQMKVCIKCKIRYNGTRIPKCVKVSRLRVLAICKNLQIAFKFNITWDQFKTKVYNTGIEVLGLRKRKHWKWFDEHDPEIKSLLKVKNDVHQKLAFFYTVDAVDQNPQHKETVHLQSTALSITLQEDGRGEIS